MKTTRYFQSLITCVAMAVMFFECSARALDFFELSDPPVESRNRISIGYNATLNVSASFYNLGGFRQSDPGPFPYTPPPSVSRSYDDGFVRIDSLDNAGGVTTFWGYERVSQLSPQDPMTATTLTMNSASISKFGSSLDNCDDPHHGVELNYQREIGPLGKALWGIEAAFGWTDVGIQDYRPVVGDLTVVSDQYDITGLLIRGGAPPPPYSGPFSALSGTVPEIPETPFNRTITTSSDTTISGKRTFCASVYQWRVGPFAEYPVSRRIFVSLSGGLSVALVDGTFSWNESATVGGKLLSTSDSNNEMECLVGGYVGGTIRCALNDHWSIFGSAKYQNLGDLSQMAGGKRAVIDFGTSILVSTGVGFSF